MPNNQNVISTYPAVITISAVGAHAFTIPELPDGQTNGSQLAQTFVQGQTFVAAGYCNNGESMAGNTCWWVGNGYYVSCSETIQQPDLTVAPMTTPPSNWAALIASETAAAAAQANPVAVITAGVTGVWNDVTSAVQSVASGVAGGDIEDILILVIVIFVIYAILKTGALNLVNFKKKSN